MTLKKLNPFIIAIIASLGFCNGYAQNRDMLFPGKPGLVSYTYRKDFEKDVPSTLDKIKALGITDMEFSNLFGKTAPELRKLIDARGIKCSSFGVGYGDLVNKTAEVAQNAKILGADYVRVAGIPHKAAFTLEEAQQAIDDFNKTGKILKEEYGLTFVYHNHGFEFQPYQDGTLYDFIVKKTDPKYVSFELDVLWAFFPGIDPAQLLTQYGNRYKALHLKDLRKGVPGNLSGGTSPENDVVLGTGQIDIPSIIKAAKKAGVQHYYIEDESSQVDVQVPKSIAYLQSLTVQAKKPLRMGIVGLTHAHVHGLLGRSGRGDVQVVGIVEPNKDLAQRYAVQHGYNMDIVFNSMAEMIAKTKPEAVAAFGAIYDHLEVVQTCAPLGIHVMVEKPLAVSLEHAKKMKMLADKYKILLMTNYETTWYATNNKAYEMVNKDSAIGDLLKVVIHDGHKGPKEIGVNKEFLDWLTDPVQNGGGAVTDFGCYGANLITWLTKGEKPESVIAITKQIKPDIYPKVDDEATIILQYPKMQGIIQASWNWPFDRKDMEVYGKTGYVFADNRSEMRIRLVNDKKERKDSLKEREYPYNDPFAFFAALVREEITLPKYDLSSLENNMIVVEILEAAKKSAKTGKAVKL